MSIRHFAGPAGSFFLCVFACLFLVSPLLRADSADTMAAEFTAPPESARPWVYWMFMDGNLTREGITADLEAMKQAGIGRAIYMEEGVGVPRGPVKFMSPEWQ